jgi:hypothetical protein
MIKCPWSTSSSTLCKRSINAVDRSTLSFATKQCGNATSERFFLGMLRRRRCGGRRRNITAVIITTFSTFSTSFSPRGTPLFVATAASRHGAARCSFGASGSLSACLLYVLQSWSRQ